MITDWLIFAAIITAALSISVAIQEGFKRISEQMSRQSNAIEKELSAINLHLRSIEVSLRQHHAGE